jgi:hypothetical protein
VAALASIASAGNPVRHGFEFRQHCVNEHIDIGKRMIGSAPTPTGRMSGRKSKNSGQSKDDDR